ncbi:MAG: alpha-amylase family glycosyl hydrolase, partial [Burkholderiaceae bacterium]
QFSSWYELFPRSQTNDPARHGTFNDVIRRLPAIKAMGFDTLYFPPIHPIGRKNRKGRNNSLTPAPNDPGSPYAIGAAEGGHDAIHPELGTLEDFRTLRQQAALHGLEIALDFAIQCSPDHPWLKQHPDWFDWRPDGSLRYAENPPKKYQDIVNVHFYGEAVIPSLWIALRDIVLFWVKEGIRVFRVDNPHTKPLPFWEWMIADIRGRYPDTIFLSEAFTRPKMMYRLAKLGFSQSYTYFTWRHTKQEFIEYITELTTTNVREYFRPHFFVNTPDINPYFLQHSGRPGFLIRAALATMLSGLWGMYSGFELCEGMPLPGKEEYLDSEKYEIRVRDWQCPGNIIQEISMLNRIRSENPALQTHLGVRFLQASSDQILYFIKTTEPVDSGQQLGDNVVLVAINLDPFAVHEADIEVPLREFCLPDDGVLDVEDLLFGTRLTWQGRQQHVRLDPFVCPYAIWRVRQRGG